MHIVFRGNHTAQELLSNLSKVLDYLHSHYGITDFSDLDLHLMLRDHNNRKIDLIDVDTYQIISVFEVYKSEPAIKSAEQHPNLKLVIDNTKKTTDHD